MSYRYYTQMMDYHGIKTVQALEAFIASKPKRTKREIADEIGIRSLEKSTKDDLEYIEENLGMIQIVLRDVEIPPKKADFVAVLIEEFPQVSWNSATFATLKELKND